MEKLILEIDQDEASAFFSLYENLSPLRKEIWRITVNSVIKHKSAFPLQSSIAKWANCSRSAVSEAFQIFQTYGWMWLKSRGWRRSKIIGIPIHLQQLDLVEKNYYYRVEATYRATSNHSNAVKHTSNDSFTLKVPKRLKNKPFSLDQKMRLSLFPENYYNTALEICRKKSENGFQAGDNVEYFIGIVKKVSEDQGFKPNWRRYYASR